MGQAVMNSAAAANEARFLALVSQLVFGKAETGGSGSATAEAQSSTSETGAPSAAAVDVAAGLELMGERMSDLMQEARRSEAASRSLLRQSSATNMSKLRLQRSTSREDGLVSSRGGGGGLASPRGQAVPAIDANAAAASGASAADEETNALVERLTEWFQTDCGIHPRDAGTFALAFVELGCATPRDIALLFEANDLPQLPSLKKVQQIKIQKGLERLPASD